MKGVDWKRELKRQWHPWYSWIRFTLKPFNVASKSLLYFVFTYFKQEQHCLWLWNLTTNAESCPFFQYRDFTKTFNWIFSLFARRKKPFTSQQMHRLCRYCLKYVKTGCVGEVKGFQSKVYQAVLRLSRHNF